MSFDLRRAFDSVTHEALLNSLHAGNLPQGFIQWTSSYLKDRHFRFSLENAAFSSFHKMTSGVPQGSVLAPLLFSAHMGSLKPSSDNSMMLKYADDVLVIIPVFVHTAVETIVSAEFYNIEEWAQTHGLFLNKDKTKSMVIHKGNSLSLSLNSISDIDHVKELKFLGTIFNERLSWDSHIAYICKNASRRMYALRRLKEAGISKPNLIVVYAFIRSVLEYNSPLFIGLNQKNCSKLRKLNRRCHRIICGNECSKDCLEDLDVRRKRRALKVFSDMTIPGNCLHELMPKRLKYSRHLEVPFSRTQRRITSFVPVCVGLSNLNV